MSARKTRLTVTVDPELVQAGHRAVDGGQAESLSAWVNQALADWVERHDKLRLLTEAVAAYEAEFGVITDEEMDQAERAAREAAIVVRGRYQAPAAAARPKRRAARSR